MLPKAEPQLPPKQGRGCLYKYPLLTAVAEAAFINAIIDTGAFISDTTDIANTIDIAIYLQDDNTANITNTTIYLQNDSNTQFSTL